MQADRMKPSGLIEFREKLSDKSELYRMPYPNLDGLSCDRFLVYYLSSSEEARRSMVYSLSKAELEALIGFLSGYLSKNPDAEIFDFLYSRYRRYVFRRMYLTWQDNYRNRAFCTLFANLLDHPKSPKYTDECGFKPAELKGIVLSDNASQTVMAEGMRSENGLIGYLNAHLISKCSHLALDTMSIFFLYCSEKDYIEIGDPRLSSVVCRYPERFQLRILKNMLNKISEDNIDKFKSTLHFFIEKFYLPSNAESRELSSALGDSIYVFRSLAEILVN